MSSSFVPSRSTGAAVATSTSQYPVWQMWLSRVIDACLYLLAFCLPWFFTTWTLDAIELNKQMMLLMLTGIAALAWLAEGLLHKRFIFARNWLHGVVGAFGLGYLLVSFMSVDRYQSIIGVLGQMGESFATVSACIVLYFVIVNHIRNTEGVYRLLAVYLASSLVLVILGLFQVFGVYLFPDAITHVVTFTPLGSVYALGAYLVIPLVIAASLAAHASKHRSNWFNRETMMGWISHILLWLFILLTVIFLVAINFKTVWAAVLFGTVVTVVIGYLHDRRLPHPIDIITPGVLALLSIIMLAWGGTIPTKVPAEAAPNLAASWSIARSALQAHPMFGTGPGTWMFDYSAYRPVAINLTDFWTTRFDRAYSTFMTLLASTGIVGILLWLILVVSTSAKSVIHLMRERDDDVWYAYLILFTGWISAVFLQFIYNTNVAHQFAFWLLLGLLGVLITKNDYHWNAKQNAGAFGALSTVFLIGVVVSICLLWLAGQRYVAEVTFTNGVKAYQNHQPIDQAIKQLNAAVDLNPLNDLYARNLAQAYVVSINQAMQQKPTPDQFTKIQSDLIKPAIDIAIKATQLSPLNVDNWSNLGLVYEAIAPFTREANQYAITAYQEAIKREPANPAFYNEIGQLYLNEAQNWQTLATTKDGKERQQAQQAVQQNLKLSEQALRKAIELKEDYFPAHYHLGELLAQQGKTKEAVGELEKALKANPKDVGVAFELAILYDRDGQSARAINVLEQIVKLDPSRVNARWLLATLYEKAGRRADAIAQLEALHKLAPDNQTVTDRLNQLKQSTKSTSTAPAILPESVTSPANQNPVK